MSEDVVLPWSEVAEQSVLGALLADPVALDSIADIGHTPDSFFSLKHREVWRAIGTLSQRVQPVDVVTVHQTLLDAGQGDESGGLAFLEALRLSVPSAAHIRHYAATVREKHFDRELIAAADANLSIARGAGNAADRLDAMQTALAKLESKTSTSAPVSLDEILLRVIDRTNDLHENSHDATAIATGHQDLDKVLGRLKPGNLLAIGARPTVGKTSFATQIVLHAAAAGHPTLFLSMEMTNAELGTRAVANLAGVDLGALLTGSLAESDWPKLSEGVHRYRGLPLYFDDTPSLTLLQIRAKARSVKGLRLLVVDYVQLAGASGREQSRHHQIESISRGLKVLAKETGATVVVLSQLSRQSTSRAEGEPTLADLKESGALEEDADIVLALHPKAVISPGVTLIAALILKNRQGRRCRLAFEFDGRLQRWRESDADVSPARAA